MVLRLKLIMETACFRTEFRFLHFLYFKLFSVLLPRQSFQALWRKELSLPLILYTAQLSVRLFTRLKLIGSGAAAGFPKWDSTILPVQRQYI